MINNQVQQIQRLTDQLNEFKHYESLFGDPKAVVRTTVQPLVNDLRKTELGETLTALEGAVDTGEAMLYNANGLFTSIGTTFNTPNGATVTRRETPYLPVAVSFEVCANEDLKIGQELAKHVLHGFVGITT